MGRVTVLEKRLLTARRGKIDAASTSAFRFFSPFYMCNKK